MSRSEKAAEAQALRSEGFYYREIAERMGISNTYAQELVKDPEGSEVRTRKDSYRGTCEECGASTDGSNGRDEAPRFCRECAPLAHSFWTCEVIIQAIREYDRRYGRPPGAMDWNRNHARSHAAAERLAEIEARWDDGLWPLTGHVQYRFGTWNAAIEAAGFEPLLQSEREDPDRWRRNRWKAAA